MLSNIFRNKQSVKWQNAAICNHVLKSGQKMVEIGRAWQHWSQWAAVIVRQLGRQPGYLGHCIIIGLQAVVALNWNYYLTSCALSDCLSKKVTLKGQCHEIFDLHCIRFR
jgi:hypothetical protein